MTDHPITTRSSPARVDPQARNPVQSQTTRDDADKEQEDEFSEDCRLRGRWVNIAIWFGVELQDIFKIGMRVKLSRNNIALADDYDSDSEMDDEEKAVYCTVYEKIIEFIPRLKTFLPVDGNGNSEMLYKFLEKIQRGCNTARSDTLKRINQFTDIYLDSGSVRIKTDTKWTRKSSRGLNHPQLGRLLIPAKHVAGWDEDPESLKMSFNTGYNRIMGYDMPLFLYYEYKYDPEDPEKGLFRSSFLVCVLIDILYGPLAVDTDGAKRSEAHRHHCVADMYCAEVITPQMIAYSAVVARFALSARPKWNYKEDNFDYRTFYRFIVMQLSDPTDPWVEETIKWWNVRVFNNEQGNISAVKKDSREQERREEWGNFIQRKAARKADAAVHTDNPSLLPARPAWFETPVDDDIDNHLGRPSSPGDTAPSCAGSDSAVHNTPISPPRAPIIDPALLNLRAPGPNNSVITQTHSGVPAAPNASTSGPEREQSPLSEPTDAETSTGTIDVPHSRSGKRKSARNNTGKGKAPPKQRRKTTQGSQSRV